jgi:threonine dehydratase
MMISRAEDRAIIPTVRPTTVIRSSRLDNILGAKIILVSETFQQTGSFKFRAAYHVATHVPQNLLITASSGNFGQALAYSCVLTGKSAIIVMPSTSAEVKIDAVRSYGARVELIDIGKITRKQKIKELSREYPQAYIASSSDDPLVIEGNSSLGREIGALDEDIDHVIAPVGGGGLISGIIVGMREAGRSTPITGAEPLLGNDAAQSLRAGQIVTLAAEPLTIADGARMLSVGKHNWKIIQHGVDRITEVPEDKIVEAVRVLFTQANLKTEPTGALSIAALLTGPSRYQNRKVCCVISGGNVDPKTYANMLI